jgi:ribulose-5-phosphate 4-epimerase/fuculose-1-phosphate aldolase
MPRRRSPPTACTLALKSGNFGGADFFDRGLRRSTWPEAALRAEICRVGRSLHARGYCARHHRQHQRPIDGGFLITGDDACLGELEPDALVRGRRRRHAGRRGARPSKTWRLHRRIYEASGRGRLHHPHPLEPLWCTRACASRPTSRATTCCRRSRRTS